MIIAMIKVAIVRPKTTNIFYQNRYLQDIPFKVVHFLATFGL